MYGLQLFQVVPVALNFEGYSCWVQIPEIHSLNFNELLFMNRFQADKKKQIYIDDYFHYIKFMSVNCGLK